MPGRIRNVVHIKHRTAGTSNELSFDVLEAKKVEADSGAKSNRRLRVPFPMGFGSGKERDSRNRESAASGASTMPQLYTNSASQAAKNIERASLPYSDPAAEIVRRKRRRTRVRLLSVAAGAAILASLAFFAYAEINRYMADQNQMIVQLGESLAIIEETDTTVVSLDQLVMVSAEDRDAEEVEKTKTNLETASKQLAEASRKAQAASEHLIDVHQRDVAQHAISAITARQEMIREGGRILEDGALAQHAAQNMNEAWVLILEADTLTQDAGRLVADTTEENVTASMEKTNDAIEKFKEAQEKVDWVANHYPKADVSAYAAYLEKRLEGQQAALDSDAAMLLQDRGSAEEHNDILYASDTEAASIARDFPEDPTEPVLSAYQANSEELREKYLQARSQATSSDAHLRDYLGEAGK